MLFIKFSSTFSHLICMTTVFSYVGGEERICFLDDEITVPLGTMRETGDFVRVQNTKLFFLGRKDNQIKRHGKRFNIECLQQVIQHLRVKHASLKEQG